MARDTDRQKLSLFDPLVDHRDVGDEEASDDQDSAEEERRRDAVPYFRHR